MGLTPRSGPALAVLALLTVAACGDGASGAADASPTVTFTASPLEPYLPLYALSADEQRAISAEAEVLIAACMKDEGFAYDQPYQPDQAPAPALDGLTPVQWAELYGYGVSTLDAADASGTASEPVERSAAEQAAYDAALYGSGSDDEVVYDWQQEGCMGAAYHEASGGADELLRDARYAELFAAVDLVREQAAASPQVAALDAEWSACVADAGHPGFATPSEAAASISTAWWTAGGSGADDVTRADLRAQEIGLATADVTCQTDLGYPARVEQVVWSAEAGLVAERQDELAALVSEAG